MSERSAVNTIRGYFYQFDYTIDKILSLPAKSDEVTIEGVEDIDIDSSTETSAIQCKYYSKSVYNHSVISKPIRLMLTHYQQMIKAGNDHIQYLIYGHYKSGHDKLTWPVDVDFLKQEFLSYSAKGIAKKHHEDLDLSDIELEGFINQLTVNIHAKTFDEQYQHVLSLLKQQFNCNDFETEYYFYNNALSVIRRLSTTDNINSRKISKEEFLNKINNKQILFNRWFLSLKGQNEYNRQLRRKYFRHLNQEPFERFFIICLPNSYKIETLKELFFIISKEYSNLKKREPNTYCPYICVPNISKRDCLELKRQLYEEGFQFIDGFPYSGASFSERMITTQTDHNNQIKAKLVDDIPYVHRTLAAITKTKEVYQFYIDKPSFSAADTSIKCVNIQVKDVDDIKGII